jgi:hypothetical protein
MLRSPDGEHLRKSFNFIRAPNSSWTAVASSMPQLQSVGVVVLLISAASTRMARHGYRQSS